VCDGLIKIFLDLLFRNNIQIGDITYNLKRNFELLPCIVNKPFKAILHLHTCFQYQPCLHNVFSEKWIILKWIICKCIFVFLHFAKKKFNRSCSIEIKDKVEERSCFIFQKKWNNCIKKTCECKPLTNLQNVWRKNEK
jgi:hypothetical protein